MDIARFLQYFKNLSSSFINILATLKDFNEIFLIYCLNITVLCGYETDRSSCSFDYFYEPCTTAFWKKPGTPSICQPSQCYHLAHDLIFFVSNFGTGLVKHHFHGGENKEIQPQYTFLSTQRPLFSFM